MVTSVEVADIARSGIELRQRLPRGSQEWRALRDIAGCRTSALGGHLYECDHCGHQRNAYNSCRNRHCPKCLTLAKERWLEKRQAELLPVGYFHLVFTVPRELHPVFRADPKRLYSLLFETATRSLLELTADPKWLGARIGILALLHTWTQTLSYHPHIHCIVPGGGLAPDGTWIPCRPKFLVPVRVLSRVFRGKFLWHLRRLIANGDILAPVGEIPTEAMLRQLAQREWVVYCKPPFGSPQRVLSYLARYTHRVAISNDRVVAFDGERVTFRWRDSKCNRRCRSMTLTRDQFLSRFLLHVLPRGFVRIRGYGLLANRNRRDCLGSCRAQLRTKPRKPQRSGTESWRSMLKRLTGIDPLRCPSCRDGKLNNVAILPRLPCERAPP